MLDRTVLLSGHAVSHTSNERRALRTRSREHMPTKAVRIRLPAKGRYALLVILRAAVASLSVTSIVQRYALRLRAFPAVYNAERKRFVFVVYVQV